MLKISWSNFVWRAIIILIILAGLHYLRVLRPVESVVVRIFTGGQGKLYQAATMANNIVGSIRNISQVVKENEALRTQVDKLSAENAYYKALERENEELRSELNFVAARRYSYLTAAIIFRSDEYGDNYFVINKGEGDGIEVGMAVTSNGLVLGKIFQIGADTSRVILLNDSRLKMAATVLNSDKTLGIVSGEYSLGVKMNLIPQNETVNVGDVVITSGLENYIPAGLVIGTVENVERSPEEIFQSATVKTNVDYRKITIVTVVK